VTRKLQSVCGRNVGRSADALRDVYASKGLAASVRVRHCGRQLDNYGAPEQAARIIATTIATMR